MSSLIRLAFTPVGPPLLYGLAAAALLLFPAYPQRQGGRFVLALITGFVTLWIAAWAVLPVPVTTTLSLAADELPPLALRTAVHGDLWPLLAAVAFLGVVGVGWPHHRGKVDSTSFGAGFLLLAATLLVIVADNLPAVLLGWAVFDAAWLLAVTRGPGLGERRDVHALPLLSLAAIWGVLVAAPPGIGTHPWSRLDLPPWANLLLGLTVWVRAGVYPFPHIQWQTSFSIPEPWLWASWLAGVGWLAHWTRVPGSDAIWGHPAWVVTAVLALFASTLEAWLTRSPSRRWPHMARQRWSALLLIPWVWRDQAIAVLATAGPATVVAGSLWRLAGNLPGWLGLVTQWAAAAWIWGFPGTLGAGWRQVPMALGQVQPLLAWGGLVAEVLLLSALVVPTPAREQVRYGVLGLAVLLGGYLGVWTGLAPRWLVSAGQPWLVSVGVPLVAGSILAWRYEGLMHHLTAWRWLLRLLPTLQPLASLPRQVGRWAWLALGGTFALFEGAGWFGWLLTAGLIAWLWLRLWGGG